MPSLRYLPLPIKIILFMVAVLVMFAPGLIGFFFMPLRWLVLVQPWWLLGFYGLVRYWDEATRAVPVR